MVPVHFEQESISETLRGLRGAIKDPYRCLVVYDLEDDPTVEVVRGGAADWPEAQAVRNAYGRGVLGAIKTGLEQATGEYAVVTMADLSDDPGVINQMLRQADAGSDVVSASRYMRGGSQEGGPPLKSLISRVAGISLHLLTRIPTHDPTNSFRLYRVSFLRETPIESTGGFELGLELTAKAYVAGRTVTEVPASWHDRTEGESKFQFRRWLPLYLRWYLYTVARAPLGFRRGGRRRG